MAQARTLLLASVTGRSTSVPAPGMHGLLGAGLLGAVLVAPGWLRARRQTGRARDALTPA
jgi:hypothetical protein